MIVTEEAIAKGIRRIVAVTGPEADRAVERAGRLADSILKLKEEIEAEETKKDRTVQKSLVKELVILSDVNTFDCTAKAYGFIGIALTKAVQTKILRTKNTLLKCIFYDFTILN